MGPQRQQKTLGSPFLATTELPTQVVFNFKFIFTNKKCLPYNDKDQGFECSISTFKLECTS